MRWSPRLACLAALLLPFPARSADAPSAAQRYRAAAEKIIHAALQDTKGYDRLGRLTDSFPARFSGSANLEHAIDWSLEELKKEGFENVHGERVMVPHWVRGAEAAELIIPGPPKTGSYRESLEPPWPYPRQLPVLGLGGSIGTPPEGITAEVLVVSTFDELKAHAAEARGRIVVFDVPFTSYRDDVVYRYAGASAAAKVGAVASLLRSLGPVSLQTPHTGGMKYEDGVPKIPSAAITAEDAQLLHRLQDRGEHPVVKLAMSAHTLPDVPSRNVIAELRGTEKPDEVVVVSGHFDSWDVGQGAQDDGGGSMAAWEAVRLLKELNLRPKRTIRLVLWVNEENGLRGGLGYRDAHAAELDKHVAAIESDNGVFKPLGFRFAGTPAGLELVKTLGPLFSSLGADQIAAGDPEADISPMVAKGVPGLALSVDGTKYFWYHHSEADTFDKVNPQEFAQCTAALAVMAYTLADLPERLPQAPAISTK